MPFSVPTAGNNDQHTEVFHSAENQYMHSRRWGRCHRSVGTLTDATRVRRTEALCRRTLWFIMGNGRLSVEHLSPAFCRHVVACFTDEFDGREAPQAKKLHTTLFLHYFSTTPKSFPPHTRGSSGKIATLLH